MKKKLTKNQMDMLWAGGGKNAYSQASIRKELRILDDRVSRTFLIVEVEINPTTFELVKKHRNDEEFKEDAIIQQLLDFAEYRGPEYGYLFYIFESQYTEDNILAKAESALQEAQDIITKMHKFIMDNYLS